MIDPADKQTASLPLEQPKRGRGRPTTGAAMTPAEKQKAYRERKKAMEENSVKLSGLDLSTIIHALAHQRAENASLSTVRDKYSELIERLEAIKYQE